MKKNLMFALTAAALLAPTASAATLPVSNNPVTFVSNAQARTRLQDLIGRDSYNTMKRNFQVTSVLQKDSRIVAYSGCQRGNCAATQSIVVYDRQNDVLKAWYHYAGKNLSAQEDGELNEGAFRSDLLAAIDNFENW